MHVCFADSFLSWRRTRGEIFRCWKLQLRTPFRKLSVFARCRFVAFFRSSWKLDLLSHPAISRLTKETFVFTSMIMSLRKPSSHLCSQSRVFASRACKRVDIREYLRYDDVPMLRKYQCRQASWFQGRANPGIILHISARFAATKKLTCCLCRDPRNIATYAKRFYRVLLR